MSFDSYRMERIIKITNSHIVSLHSDRYFINRSKVENTSDQICDTLFKVCLEQEIDYECISSEDKKKYMKQILRIIQKYREFKKAKSDHINDQMIDWLNSATLIINLPTPPVSSAPAAAADLPPPPSRVPPSSLPASTSQQPTPTDTGPSRAKVGRPSKRLRQNFVVNTFLIISFLYANETNF